MHNENDQISTSAEGCLFCGSGLTYLTQAEPMSCSICQSLVMSTVRCVKGHFVCDNCHALEGNNLVEIFCANSESINPIAMATAIMHRRGIKMHGPEHHFLVPAVLITAYYNKTGQRGLINNKLKIARERAKMVPGGSCGFCGNCGAAVGTGIFMSIVLNSSPLAKEEWRLSNLMTAEALFEVARMGGPRCCKRDTWLAIKAAIRFVKEHLNVTLESSDIHCSFFGKNKECLQTDCAFYPTKH